MLVADFTVPNPKDHFGNTFSMSFLKSMKSANVVSASAGNALSFMTMSGAQGSLRRVDARDLDVMSFFHDLSSLLPQPVANWM